MYSTKTSSIYITVSMCNTDKQYNGIHIKASHLQDILKYLKLFILGAFQNTQNFMFKYNINLVCMY